MSVHVKIHLFVLLYSTGAFQQHFKSIPVPAGLDFAVDELNGNFW